MTKSRVELVRASKPEGLALRRDPQRLAILGQYAVVQYEATQYASATLERLALLLNTPNLFVALVLEHHLEILASKNLNLNQHIPFSVALEVLLSEHLYQLQDLQQMNAIGQALHLTGRFAALTIVPLKHPKGALLGCIGVPTPLPIRLPASQQTLLELLAADLLEKIDLRLAALHNKSQAAPVMDADLWSLLSSTSEAILAQDLDGKICFWNRAAEQLYGYDPQQTIGRELGFLLSPEANQIILQLTAQVLSGESVAPFLVEHRHSSGFRVNVRMAISRLQDKAGKTRGLVMVCGVPDNPQQTMQHLMLERLTQHIPMLTLQLDSSGVVLAAQGKIFERSLVKGQPAKQVFADSPEMLSAIQNALDGQFLHSTLQWQQRYFECWFVPWQQGMSLLALDVSQQMQARLALEVSENQMRELLHALPIYIWRCDPFGAITMLDYASTDQALNIVVGQNIFDLFSNSSAVVLGMRNILMGETQHFEVEWAQRHFELWGSPFFIADRIAGATGVAIDVSPEFAQRQALEQAQTALRQEQERTHIIANSISQGFSIVDNDGVFVYVNPARAELQGYRVEEMIGQPVTAFLEPSEHARFLQMSEWARSGEPIQSSRRIKHRDGSWLEVQLLAKAWYKDGKVAGVVSILNDITVQQALERQQKSQQRFLVEERTMLMPVFENSSQGMALLGEDGVVEYINPALQQMLSLQEVPLYCHAFFDPQELPHLETLWAAQQHQRLSRYQARLQTGQLVQLEEVPDIPQKRFLGSVLVVKPIEELVVQPIGELVVKPIGELVVQPIGELVVKPIGELVVKPIGELVVQPIEQEPSSGVVVLPDIATALQFMRGVGGVNHFQAGVESSQPEPKQPRLVLRGRSLSVVVLSGTLEEYKQARGSVSSLLHNKI